MNKHTAIKTLLALALVCALSGCADHVTFQQAATHTPVGFWYGLWHGMICPISWLVSLFDDDVAIYAIYNNGGWYDFGFLLGIGSLGGSATSSSSSSRSSS